MYFKIGCMDVEYMFLSSGIGSLIILQGVLKSSRGLMVVVGICYKCQ